MIIDFEKRKIKQNGQEVEVLVPVDHFSKKEIDDYRNLKAEEKMPTVDDFMKHIVREVGTGKLRVIK